MKALVKTLFAIIIFSLHISTYAGSRDAYFALIIDLDSGKNSYTKRLVEDYFNGNFSESIYDCAINNGGRFELSYIRLRPKSITNSLISSALTGNHQHLRRIQKSLRDYKDAELNDGFDFLLAYRSIKSGIEFSIISASAQQKILQKRIQAHPSQNTQQAQIAVAQAVCELSGAMPFVVTP